MFHHRCDNSDRYDVQDPKNVLLFSTFNEEEKKRGALKTVVIFRDIFTEKRR